MKRLHNFLGHSFALLRNAFKRVLYSLAPNLKLHGQSVVAHSRDHNKQNKASAGNRLSSKLHDYLMLHSVWYQQWYVWRSQSRFRDAATSLYLVLVVVAFASVIHPVSALSNWVQTDWSGGIGASTANQYSSAANVNTANANQLTLSTGGEKFTNTGFESDTNGWTTGELPSTITGLRMWLKADAITGKNDGDTIQTWTDSGSNGNNPTQATAGSRATYKTNIINGLPVLRFNGTSNQYGITLDTGIALNNYSLFVVHRPTSASQYGMVFGSTTGNSDAELLDMNYPSAGKIGTYHAGPGNIGGAYSFTSGTPLISSFVASSGTGTPYNNGTAQSSGTTATQTVSNWVLGNYTTGSYYYTGDIAEIILYSSGLSAANRISIENYLASKYGITVSSGLTVTRDTSIHHSGTASAKIVATNQGEYSQQVNLGNTNNYNLVAYAYIDGSTAVDSSYAQLFANGSVLTTTYSSVGGGWYKLSAVTAGSASSAAYGVQVKAGKTIYIDDLSLTNYVSSGTLTSNIYDTTVGSDWGTLSYSATTPINTTVSVKVRAGNNADLSDATAFASCSAVASGTDLSGGCSPDNHRYVQYQVTLSTSDNSNSPTLSSVTVPYSPSDIIAPPTNASSLAMKTSPGGTTITSNSWTNDSTPYFSWTAGADDGGGSGIKGYCLYLGTDNTANPVTTKGLLGTSPVNTGGACQFAVSGTSVDLSTAGYIGTALTTSNSPYYLSIKAIDNANNVYSGASAQFHFRFDNTPPTNPTFITAPSQFISTKDVTLTWPTSGSDAPADANSGLAGLQYRIGNSGTWYGDSHTGSQDASDLLTNDGSYETVSSPDYANLSDGNNIIYFRTWDSAGNISPAYVTTVIKINTSSPSSPQNVTAAPSTNTTNSFAFNWLAPATFTGSASNITYCYTINALPNSSNCTYTAAGVTSLSAGAYATQPGDNTFYVVAKDEAGNINYATAASTTFTANTSAPGVPLNVEIADVSNKDTSSWKLALSWNVPTNVGAGINSYKVYRSTDGISFSQVASTAGTSNVDTGLSQITYYYEIKACDSANNCGAFSSVVNKMPTGKFTSPANLISQPSVTVSTRTATITWVTDRVSDSRVQFGTATGQYFATEASNSDQVTSHRIQLTNLSAGTTYYYQAKWGDIDGNIGTSGELMFTTQPAPLIQGVSVLKTTLSSAIIQFTSQDAIQVNILYGKLDSLGGLKTINTSTSKSTYAVELDGLDDGATYSYKLNTFDIDDNEYDSNRVDTFTTPARPHITNLQFQPVANEPTSTQKITWTTNVPATSLIDVTASGQPKIEQIDTNLVTDHSMLVRNLLDDTQYTLTAQSNDKDGNIAVSDPNTFHTALDTRPPEITGTNTETSVKGNGAEGRGQIIVSWKTDEPATSQVAYGEGSGGTYNNKTSEDDRLTFDHVVIVSDLATSKVYHIQPMSKDKAGNLAKGTDQSAIIGQATDNVLTIILNSLQKVFGL